MSEAHYGLGGLRFWSENEINFRELFVNRISFLIRETLLDMNPAWGFMQVEGPCLTPRNQISNSYTDADIFVTNHESAGANLCLRAETTNSSYLMANKSRRRLPLCVWQVGKSFRRELNDGASAAKLRFNEFWQAEFQCIYATNTKADYREQLMQVVCGEVKRHCGETRIVESDRLPSYSESTLDIEVLADQAKWREIASCSIRNDFSPETKVCEIALGLDRIVELSAMSGIINLN